MIIQCSACQYDLDTEEHEVHELEDEPAIKLCDLCFNLNNLASEYDYDDVRQALSRLEGIGSPQA